MSLNDQKKIWCRGFRDANTGVELRGRVDVDPEFLSDAFGIPRSLRKDTLDDITPANEKQLIVMNYMYDMTHNWKGTHSTMIVTGGNGSGKSYLGAALIHSLALEQGLSNGIGRTARFTDEASLSMRVSGMDFGASFALFTKLIDVLVIDEFAMTAWSPSDKKKIEQILGIRYSNGLKTILLTNRTSDELFGGDGKEPILSSQLRSRYAGGYLVNFTSADYRRNTEALKRDLETGGNADDWLF